jgi:hypothetical protein
MHENSNPTTSLDLSFKYSPGVGAEAQATIGSAIHKEMWGESQVDSIILSPLTEYGYTIPQGNFLDIGTGFGAIPIALARQLKGQYPESKFIGVDLSNIADKQVPLELQDAVLLIENTDGFLYLSSVRDRSLSFVTLINIAEAIGSEGPNDRLSSSNNIGFLGQELLRVLMDDGIVFISGGFSEVEVQLFCSFRNESGKILVLPVEDNNPGRLKNRFFQKVSEPI